MVQSLTLTPGQIEQLRTSLPAYSFTKTPPYAVFQAKLEGCTITAYSSGKVVFQGNDAEYYASPYTEKKEFVTQCGSDEVGTGDYFGPVVVCACYLDKTHYPLLKQYKIQDSKQLTDPEIISIARELIDIIPHSLLILDPARYNQVHKQYNMNKIKAILHNKCYCHLQKKTGSLPSLRVVDQFCEPDLYYKYLSQEPEIINSIHFTTKAENKFPAVAIASIFARYGFLCYFEKMEEQYDIRLHKGASDLVDEDIRRFIEKHGKDALQNVGKLHFRNTEKALG
ncbi:MAG: ribonuclease HIII [Erysipelotrichaceae bacterium]|nr:ribonuclease HIII [Erysipelotrichaceae bacterium]